VRLRKDCISTSLKSLKKSIDKDLSRIGTDIESQTGISNDIADSICIAICLFNNFGDFWIG
jgi:hypothetical protein